MADNTKHIETRIEALLSELLKDEGKYIFLAKFNYYVSQILLWASLIASGIAALFGLIPALSEIASKWQIGLASAISLALVTFSRQVGFQQKANWHYRKVDGLRTLRRQLQFELPTSPTVDDVAAISRARSELDSQMSKEWETIKLGAASNMA